MQAPTHRLSKLCARFSIFDSVSFLYKVYIFVQQNVCTLWLQNVIVPFKIKVKEKPHTALLPDASRPLVFSGLKSFKIQ